MPLISVPRIQDAGAAELRDKCTLATLIRGGQVLLAVDTFAFQAKKGERLIVEPDPGAALRTLRSGNGAAVDA